MRRDLADQLELVGGITVPIYRDDAKRSNLLKRLRQNASAVKVRKKQVNWLRAMQAAYFVLEQFWQLWAVLTYELSGCDRIRGMSDAG